MSSMTTDITELAQRDKFEAWAEEAGALPWGILGKHRKQDGNYPGPHYTYMWKAWQAASAELVEALEKAQSANAAQDDHINQQQDRIEQLEKGHQEAAKQITSWFRMAKQNIAEREKDIAELDAARQRIAELEESHAQVIQSRDHYKRMSEEGLKQLAESRTVTVKLPKRSVVEVMHMSGFSRDYAEGWCAGNDNAIHQICNTPGIKWEAE
ncbi:ead/Ea22-like family protein [Klebsiella aerogenes]|uniref:ead/Ea22-like family protein n=1 Tax=Klebsiella aerogenes TaxID=548 RepID=UPI00291C3E81|nr:ead/Ea22-like family protein [Klebsiella aerogenes]MDU9141251.1 ead/Ea22-like family protein [Klebsiella aerogenes]